MVKIVKPKPMVQVTYDWIDVSNWMRKKYPEYDWSTELFNWPSNGELCWPPEWDNGDKLDEMAKLLHKEFPKADKYYVWW